MDTMQTIGLVFCIWLAGAFLMRGLIAMPFWSDKPRGSVAFDMCALWPICFPVLVGSLTIAGVKWMREPTSRGPAYTPKEDCINCRAILPTIAKFCPRCGGRRERGRVMYVK